MILAAIPWLSITINLLLVVFVVVCFLMTLVILMQRPKQEGLGAAFGAGVTDQVFGARTTNVLQRGTVYLASFFFILSLALAILIGKQNQRTTLLSAEEAAAPTATEAPAAEAEAPAAPPSLVDQLPPELATPPVTDEAPAEETPAETETPAGDAASVETEASAETEAPVEAAPEPAEAEPAEPAEAPAGQAEEPAEEP
jgi:preprotein translocase subunit SecG